MELHVGWVKEGGMTTAASLIHRFLRSVVASRMGGGMARAILVCMASALLLVQTTRSWCGQRPTLAHVQSSMPCTEGARRQFDFWVGDWDVFDVERPTVVVAHARVELILNGCVLHETYESVDGHKGESFSIYDATR